MKSRAAAFLLVLALVATPEAFASVWSAFTARDLEGGEWTAEELEGRVVLLDFWATWCAPCLAAIPVLRDASERFADSDFLILGVSLDRGERRDLESFLDRQRMDWPQFHDGRGVDGALARRFGVEEVPRTFLVDRSGRVVGVDLTPEALMAALPPLLARGTEGSSPEPAPADSN